MYEQKPISNFFKVFMIRSIIIYTHYPIAISTSIFTLVLLHFNISFIRLALYVVILIGAGLRAYFRNSPISPSKVFAYTPLIVFFYLTDLLIGILNVEIASLLFSIICIIIYIIIVLIDIIYLYIKH